MLFLDEPTSGLDPVATREVRGLIENLRSRGVTVFLTTHRLEEAERLCDRVAILNTTLRIVGRPEELRHRLFSSELEVRVATPLAEPDALFGSIAGVRRWSGVEGTYRLEVEDPARVAPEVARSARGRGRRRPPARRDRTLARRRLPGADRRGRRGALVNLRVVAVLRKELREYRRNKFVVGTMIVLPVIFLIIPIGNVLAIQPSMSPDAIRATVGGVTLTLFFVPLILPATLSAYSVIGERDQGTLEPVLTTPVTREELLLGKALAILVPTVAVSYVLYVVFLFVVRAAATPAVVDLIWQAGQAGGVVLFAPLLATFAVWVGIAWSTRSSDVRVAQQLSVLATLPMLGVIALFSFRIIEPTLAIAGVGVIALGAIDVVGWLLVSAMFDRERLLTRYGSP